MKKILFAIISIVLAALTSVAFTGCSGAYGTNTSKPAEDTDKLTVVTTIFPPYDFVRNIAEDNVELSMLLPIGTESHSFDPTPQDIIKIQNADVFIYTGGEGESWVERILSSLDTSKMKVISMLDLVEAVPEEIVEGMEHEHDEHDDEDHDDDEHASHEHEEAELDEHVWTSPLNAKIIVEKISEVLSELDDKNADTYKNNEKNYAEKLTALDGEFSEIAANAKRKTIVFGDRFPLRYFADEYGLDYYAAFPGCSTDTEPSAGTVTFLINKVNEEQIPVVFHIELSNEKMADTICAETGAKKLLMHSCHNLTKNDFDAGKGYVELMQSNAEALREALF